MRIEKLSRDRITTHDLDFVNLKENRILCDMLDYYILCVFSGNRW